MSGPRPKMKVMKVWKATLYISGGALEFSGITLIASPDLGPLLHRVGRYARERRQHALGWMRLQIRRLLRRPRPHKVIPVGIASEQNVAARLSAKVTPNPDATDAEKIEFCCGEPTRHKSG